MTTFVNLRARASVRFRDTAFNIVTDAQWKDYVNEAYQEVNEFTPLWPWLETSEQTVTVAANTRGIALPTDVVQVNWAYDTTDNLQLKPLETKGAQWAQGNLRTDTGVPVSYRLRGANIEVFPLPTANTALVLECVLQPVRMSADADLPVFPSAYHDLLVPGALARAFLDDGNDEFHTQYDTEFQRQLARMRDAILAFRTEAYVTVRDNFWG